MWDVRKNEALYPNSYTYAEHFGGSVKASDPPSSCGKKVERKNENLTNH